VTPRLAEYYGLCHPLSDRKWYAPSGWRNALEEVKKQNATETWSFRNRLKAVKSAFLFPVLDVIALYRLHMVAIVLFVLAVLSVVFNTYSWAVQTWIWVPASA
jgi:hypothetical protein